MLTITPASRGSFEGSHLTPKCSTDKTSNLAAKLAVLKRGFNKNLVYNSSMGMSQMGIILYRELRELNNVQASC